MKIIKEGISKEEVERKKRETKRFECKTCYCIFEADKGEYEYEDNYIYGEYRCKCPNCMEFASEQKLRTGGQRFA